MPATRTLEPVKSMSEQSPKAVGIWIRVSTEDQARGDSPEHHERRARMYAEAKDWEVAEVYHLEAVSGKSVMDHAETERMLQDVSKGHITGLIFSKLARLARNTRELLDFADIFRKHEADLVSLHEAIDTTTPAGRLFYTMIAAMAQWEREEIADRVAASVKVRAKMGKPLGGKAPFGYRWKDKEIVPDPKEAPVRRRMYELFVEHKRFRTVARLLNEAGHRTRRGAKFSYTTVRRLLEDPIAKGWRRVNYTKSLGNGSWEPKREEEWEWHQVEPIVSEELWGRVNAIIEERRRDRKARPAKKAKHVFAGVTRCRCGTKMYVPSNTPKYVCRDCRNKMPVVDLEGVFHEQLKAFVFSPEDVADVLHDADERIKEKEELLGSLETEKKRVKGEMDKIYRAYVNDRLPMDAFGREYKPLNERFTQLDEELPRLQGEIDFLKIQYLSSDEVLSEARDLYARWPKLSQKEKRCIVEEIVEEITIGEDEVEIELRYLTPSLSSHVVVKGHRTNRGSWRPPA